MLSSFHGSLHHHLRDAMLHDYEILSIGASSLGALLGYIDFLLNLCINATLRDAMIMFLLSTSFSSKHA